MNLLARPPHYNGTTYQPRRRYVHARASVTWSERWLVALVILGFSLSLLAALAVALFLIYVSAELVLAIVRLVRDGVH